MKTYQLTIPQQNIWNLQKYYGDTAIANLCGAIFYQDERDSHILCQAVAQFIRSQSAIRMKFSENEEVVQYISQEENERIPIKEFSTREAFEQYAKEFAKKPIGLTDCKMYRFVIFQIGKQTGVLAALSHMIADAWTFGLMANQVDEVYHQLVEGQIPDIPGAGYEDFIAAEEHYLNSEKYRKDQDYWEEKYKVRPECSNVKTVNIHTDQIRAKRMQKRLSFSLEKNLQVFCSRYSVTPAVVFETVVIAYLSKINPENHTITIGIPVLNRANVQEKRIAGMFVSTMPLTVHVDEQTEIETLVKNIAREHMQIFRHQKYPYSDILKYLREKKDFSGNFYDVMISYQNARTETGATTRWYTNGYSEIPLAIHIDNRDGNESHTITMDYQTAVFEEQEAVFLLKRLEYILEQIVSGWDKKLGAIDIVPRQELQILVEDFNDTQVEYAKELCVHELFEAQAKRTPERIAIIAQDRTLRYRELDLLSNRVAHLLIEKNVKIGDIVAFSLSRKSYMIVIMLGILKCGAAYMPIDTEYPQDRIEYMLSDSNAKIYITEKNCQEYLLYSNDEKVYLNMSSQNPCYCLYTSGSTGLPKGTLMHHKGLSNLISNTELCTDIDKYKHIALLTTITFDVATQEIFTTLLHGCTGYLFDDKRNLSVSDLIISLEEKKIDIMFSTPSYLNILTSKNECAKRLLQITKSIVLAGEDFFVNKNVKRQMNESRVVFQNQYGPAETHVVTTCTVNGFSNITIGKPIANTQIYILDKENHIQPVGVAGELCIAGDGVGLGYLNRPELTAERFVANPFATEQNHHGAVMYHTGDLARFRVNGELEYLGRIDTQVKIRGLRIELGEIESVMGSFEGIELSAVTSQTDENGRQYLAGYYTAQKAVDERQLRNYLSSKLPQYMIPNYFMQLNVMPMTASGKTDRKNLPKPEFTETKTVYIAPETDTEKKLAEIWKKLLKLPKISRMDDFFEVGGDSLLAIALVTEIESEFAISFSIREVLEQPILEQLARCVEQSKKSVCSKIIPLYKNKYELLPQQMAIYAACQKKNDVLYNMPAKIMLPDDIDLEKLKESIRKVVKHHKILNCFIQTDADAVCGIYDEDAQLVFENYKPEHEAAFVRPFDLGVAPLVHVGLTGHTLLFDIHHIVADGETLNIILRDIVRAYEGSSLSENESWYGDYVQFFRSCDFTEAKDYFKRMLTCDFEKVVLPQTRNKKQGGYSYEFEIPKEIVNSVRKYAKQNYLTDTMIFFGVYAILLSKYTVKKEVLSSIILQNRTHKELGEMAGMFVNTLPVCINTAGEVQDYFDRIRELMQNLYRYQELPYLEIAKEIGMQDKAVINTSFVYQADGEKVLVLNGKRIIPEISGTGTSKFDLMMELTLSVHGISVRFEYDGTQYDEALMNRLATSYIQILTQLEKENIADITVMSEEEYVQVVERFNDTYIGISEEKCVHELFEEQAKKTPETIALVFEEKKLTYRELDEMSSSLAYFLQNQGVCHGDKVAVLLKRDENVVITQLAVLKLGAVFIPIDRRYPKDRILFILKESQAKIMIKNMDHNIIYGKECCIEEWKSSCINGFTSFKASCDDPCYIIFTSGSTGIPKGCVLTNRGIANFCKNNNILETCNTLDKPVCVSVNTISFDYFIAESLLPLLNGYTVVLASEEESTNQELFAKLILKNQVNIMQTTPTRYKIYFSRKAQP